MTIYSKQSYLSKRRYYPRFILQPPNPNIGIIIVIPVFAEKYLSRTLSSLANTHPPKVDVEVIIVLNASDKTSEQHQRINEKTKAEFLYWKHTYSGPYTFYLLDCQRLPPKHAGVGLARKIGMDEAVDRFEQINNEEGIIVGLDADCKVAPNYLQAIEQHFESQPMTQACSIHFEHPIQGTEFEKDVYIGITYYELFLRYYIQGLRYSGYPFAYHTIGSSMAVKSYAYQQQGGMNKRKAGEDFYFLHKFTILDKLSELHHTCIFPSPRPSDKVPFGTGKSIQQWLDSSRIHYQTYHPAVFEDLRMMFQWVNDIHDFLDERSSLPLPNTMISYLEVTNAIEDWKEIKNNTKSRSSFIHRWWKWWDGLKVLKYVHFAMTHTYPKKNIIEAGLQLITWAEASYPTDMYAESDQISNVIRLLYTYRKWQNPNYPLPYSYPIPSN